MNRAPAFSWTILGSLLAAAAFPGCEGSHSHPSPPPAQPTQPTLVRGPFVAEQTATSIVIAWSTDIVGTGQVAYSTGGGPPVTADEAGPSTDHAVTITGLDPGTAYSYEVRTDGTTLVLSGSFKTAREASDPRLRFVVFGDSGTGSTAQIAVAAQVAAADPDLVLITGDVIYPDGQASGFDPFYFAPYQDLVDHIPFYASLGNHDVRTSNGAPYLEAFHLPHNNLDQTERYYSFEASGALCIALDSTGTLTAGSVQRTWLAGELAKAAAWKFVFFHHPPFSSGPHGSDLALRADLEPLFDAAGVDMVFNGHDHDYERTYPLDGGVVVNQGQEPHYASPAGTVYVVTAGGGQSLYAKQTVNPFTAFYESTYHMVQVDIDGSSLTLTAIRSNGSTMDTMTIDK